MGNPNLVIIFNNELSFIVLGTDYIDRNEAIRIGILKYNEYVSELFRIADYPDELPDYEIKSINVYPILEAE